eukprot:UC1_evm2s1034
MSEEVIRGVAQELKNYVDKSRRETGWVHSSERPRGFEYNVRADDSVRKYVQKRKKGGKKSSSPATSSSYGGPGRAPNLRKDLVASMRQELARADKKRAEQRTKNPDGLPSPWKGMQGKTFAEIRLGTADYTKEAEKRAAAAMNSGKRERKISKSQRALRKERERSHPAAQAGTAQLVDLASEALVNAEARILRQYPEYRRPVTPPRDPWPVEDLWASLA